MTRVAVDPEFSGLIPALLPDEFVQLEANILRDGCRDPLSVWKNNGDCVLLDGHNRLKICEKHGKEYKTTEIEISDRDHAKLWIAERQLGRRNLTDDQRSVVANDVREFQSEIARKERAVKAREVGGKATPQQEKERLSAKLTEKRKPSAPKDTRKAVAREAKLPERKIRLAQEIKKAAPEVSQMVRAGRVSLVEGKRIASLPPMQRQTALDAVQSGSDVRTAIRSAKKTEYVRKISAAKPKKLEGTYRIIYADPPWKYVGLNQADEYGHAERHYECLDDEQLKSYKVGGIRLVKEIADENSVLFLWVTSPLLARCFAIIDAWGFSYKSSFVWDKVKHNMGHYNSVRHEFLLICTRGSCTPDSGKLIDSVQSIERTDKHSEKPEEFRRIVESMYDHGRRLELFRRGDAPKGWDVEGNESE
jgi:N6-adenosine-specific RNA methylase IME4